MYCPFCGYKETTVRDSRGMEDGASIRRRRACPSCGARFTTFERIELRELFVVKKNGRQVPFEREKLLNSLRLALRKRPVTEAQIQGIVNQIVRTLENSGDTEIPSRLIGHHVMIALGQLDKVAYIRYASVYEDFHEPSDFGRFLATLQDFALQSEETNSFPEEDASDNPLSDSPL